MSTNEKYGVITADPAWSYTQFRSSANGAAESAMTTQSLKEICQVRAGHRWADDNCVLVLWATGPKMFEATTVMRAWGFEHKTMIPWIKTFPKKSIISMGGIGIWHASVCEYILFGTRGKVGGFYNVGAKNEKGKREFTRLRPRPPGILVGPREYPVFCDARVNDDPDYWNSLTPQALLAPAATKTKGEVNHSKKPLALYEFAESFPGAILELYARQQPVASFDPERKARWTSWGLETGVELGSWGAREKKSISEGLF